MAVPKRRTSVSRAGKRRSHQAVTPMSVNTCKNCGAIRRPHRVCESCGWYRDQQVAPSKD